MIDPSKITAASRRKLLEERRKKREANESERNHFNNCISKVRDQSKVSEFNKLIKTIEREGERLSHFRSMAQLDHYKKKVRDFVERANRASYKIKSIGFVDSSGDYSSHLMVEKVDKALDDLTNFILKKETQSLQILEKLDLIKGLLTDLYQ